MFDLRERIGAPGSAAGLATDVMDRLAQAVMMTAADGRSRYAKRCASGAGRWPRQPPGSARGVSIATVRSQIKAILGKTNSRRTPGALSRLSRLSAIAPRGQLSTEP